MIKKPPPPPEVVSAAAEDGGATAAVHPAAGNQHRAAAHTCAGDFRDYAGGSAGTAGSGDRRSRPKPAPQAAVRSARVACPNYVEVMSSIAYPREALKDNIEGEVVIEFTVTACGQVKDPVIKSSTNRVFNRVSMAVVDKLSCQGQGQDVRVQAPIGFKLR